MMFTKLSLFQSNGSEETGGLSVPANNSKLLHEWQRVHVFLLLPPGCVIGGTTSHFCQVARNNAPVTIYKIVKCLA